MGFAAADPFSKYPAIREEVYSLIYLFILGFFPSVALFTPAATVIDNDSQRTQQQHNTTIRM